MIGAAQDQPRISPFDVHPLDALAAVIIFASTLYIVPHAAFALGAGLIVLRHGVRLQQRDLLLAVFIVGSLLNVLFHSGEQSLADSISSMGVPLIALTVMAARGAPPQFMLFLVILFCVEVPFGVFEFMTNRVAMTAEQAALANQGIDSVSDLLYNKRVFGLSTNSSVFAEKLFLGIVILFGLNTGRRLKIVLMALLFVGLYVTFNRTAILSTVLFFAAVLFFWATQSPRRIPLAVALGAGAVIAVGIYIQPLIDQFTRGTGVASYAEISRIQYMHAALGTLMENPLFGNGSLSWRVYDPLFGSFQHAHNSILMLFAENGVILGVIFIVFVALGIRRQNLVYLGVMLAFSLTQYFFFWNMSVADLALHYFTRFGKETDILKPRAHTPMPWERRGDGSAPTRRA